MIHISRAPAERYARVFSPISSSEFDGEMISTQSSGATGKGVASACAARNAIDAHATSGTRTPISVSTEHSVKGRPFASCRANSAAKCACSNARRLLAGLISIFPLALSSILYGRSRSEGSRRISAQRTASVSAVATFPIEITELFQSECGEVYASRIEAGLEMTPLLQPTKRFNYRRDVVTAARNARTAKRSQLSSIRQRMEADIRTEVVPPLLPEEGWLRSRRGGGRASHTDEPRFAAGGEGTLAFAHFIE